MAYKVFTFSPKVGDTGVTQADDGSGGTEVSVALDLTVDTGWFIVNIISVMPDGIYNAPPTITAPSSTNPWNVQFQTDFSSSPYPVASGTGAGTITVLAGEGFLTS